MTLHVPVEIPLADVPERYQRLGDATVLRPLGHVEYALQERLRGMGLEDGVVRMWVENGYLCVENV